MRRDRALFRRTGGDGLMPPATWDTMLLCIDTHRRPERKHLLQRNAIAFRWAVRENAKDLRIGKSGEVDGNPVLHRGSATR